MLAGQKVFAIVDTPSTIKPSEKKMPIDKQEFKGRIEFKDVWFRYPTRMNEWIFKGLNLVIEPNESIAIVGESGCGKSTLTSLIYRFYDVEKGKILFDGVDIKEFSV